MVKTYQSFQIMITDICIPDSSLGLTVRTGEKRTVRSEPVRLSTFRRSPGDLPLPLAELVGRDALEFLGKRVSINGIEVVRGFDAGVL